MAGFNMRKRLLVSSAIASVALFSAPAFAQDDQAPAAEQSDGEEIIVTGSRIPQPNLESASPVTVVGAAEIKQTGTTRVEDLINSLPQVFAGQGGSISNGATGTATIDLRNLGATRTLKKPFDLAELLATINEVLAATPKGGPVR